MASLSPALGILNLERGLPEAAPPPAPSSREHSLLNPATFELPILLECVKGAWADIVVRGDPALEPAYVDAAKRLVDRGAVVISSNCGFNIRYQESIAAAVGVPVVTSSLLLLPTLLRQIPDRAKIAVLTADSKNLTRDLLGTDSSNEARVVIGGIQGGHYWTNEFARPPVFTETCVIEREVTGCIVALREGHPEIAVVLLECTAFPMVAPQIRRATGLPVYDITDVCRLALRSVGISCP